VRPLIRNLADKLGFNPAAWILATRRMRRRVGEFEPATPARSDAPRFAIVIMPWMGTAVPWFSLTCGLLLASNGNKVSFIVDDLAFGEHERRSRFIVACVLSVLRRLQGRHDTVLLSKHRSQRPLGPEQHSRIERLAELNAVWALRGELQSQGREQHTARTIQQLSAGYSAITAALGKDRYDAVFVPGGVWGSSGVWTDCARAAGIRVASFDSGGYGNLLLAVDGIACQLQDIPRAFSMLKADAAAPQRRGLVIDAALAEMARRRAGTDKFSSQIQSASLVDARFDGAVLIALNSSWDSAALGLHEVFDSTAQWIVETVKYLLQHSAAPVVVRQHPVERLAIARSSDDYRELLTAHFGNDPRLHFVAAADPVNSYDLLERAAAVVVYTSTFGIEAAAQSKPVVTASRSYYADLGFVRRAQDRGEYQRALADAAAGRIQVTTAARDDALFCYYLTQCCNWVFTPFTVESFAEWSSEALALLTRHDSVRKIVAALERNIPVAYLNHVERLAPTATA
jgi:hypothetical protein